MIIDRIGLARDCDGGRGFFVSALASGPKLKLTRQGH
jgi:hypothetical protein